MAKRSATVKVAYDLNIEAKHKLMLLKADLRLAGVSATETGILELLIAQTDVKRLLTAYRRKADE